MSVAEGRMSAAASASEKSGPAVLYQVRDTGVAVITLNRPERLNSWGADISNGVYAAFDRAEADESVRVIVLTGTGKGFCAGAYMGAMQDLGESINGDTDVSKIVGERHPHFLTGCANRSSRPSTDPVSASVSPTP